MRYEVKKFLFFGDERERKRFFSEAQKRGFIQFVDAHASKTEMPESITTLINARKVLSHQEAVKQEELEDLSQADFIAKRVVHLSHLIERFEEEQRVLDQEIARIQIFGDFSMDDVRYIQKHGNRRFQFFCGKNEVEETDELFYVGQAYELYHYVAITKDGFEHPDLTEMHIEHPLGELRHKHEEARAKQLTAEQELKTFAKRKTFLREALIEKLNKHNLLTSENYIKAMFDSKVFAVEAWVPVNHMDELTSFLKEYDIHCEEIGVDKKEIVPTYLENTGFAEVGEDIVHIYDTPSDSDRDPSRWVLWFFVFFFGVIMGDAVYGTILLAISLFIWFKFGRNRTGFARRFGKLCLIISAMSIMWGVLTNSYLGLDIPPDSPVRTVSVTNWLANKKVNYVRAHPEGARYKDWTERYPILTSLNTNRDWLMNAVREKEGKLEYEMMSQYDSNMLMELALLIGILHIMFGFLRMIDKVWSGVGWILFMVGGYLFFPSVLNAVTMVNFVLGVPEATSTVVGLPLIWLGVGSAVVLAVIKQKWSGFGEVANVIQVFADVLSYLRLYALALAGGMMSATFNQLGLKAGLIFGIPIIILGHAITIGLNIMGGVIHGLRLNFLEWYRHCFEGGGKMLKPLKLFKQEK